MLNPQLRAFALQIEVAQLRLPGLGQAKTHMRDHGTSGQPHAARQIARAFGRSLGRVLEDRIPVAERALRGVQRKSLAGGQINRVQRVKTVLQLDAIRADVLHRGRAHGAGDQRQIFEARIAVLQGPCDRVVPDLAGSDLDNPVPVGLFDQTHALDFHLQHHRFDIAGDHDIAAATQHEHGLARQLRLGDQVEDILHGVGSHQGVSTRNDAKGVAKLEGNVVLD